MASADEISRRHARLTTAMQAAGYDALVVAGNSAFNQRGYIRWLTDWRLFGGSAYLVVHAARAPVFLLGLGAQAEWAAAHGVIADTRAVLDKIAGVLAALHETTPAPRRIGVVGLAAIVPYGDATRLIAGLPAATLDDATGLVETLWATLSAEDLGEVEAAHALVAEAFAAFRAALQPGRTERDVVAEAYAAAARRGCLEGIVHLSHEAGAGTRPATARRVERGDLVKMFMEFLTPQGYLIELGRCFSFGPPPAAWQRKFDLVAGAIGEAMAASRPGLVADDIVATIRRYYERAGVEIVGRRL
jgi:Xaa-Pro aminopeptidase